jgi:hypothetical protein
MKLRGGGIVPNPFWFEQGRSKAIRNAMQDMMPADWLSKMIREWTKAGKVKKLTAPIVFTGNQPTFQEEGELKDYFAMVSEIKTNEEATNLEGQIRDDMKLTGRQKWVLRTRLSEKRKTLPDTDPSWIKKE